MLDALVDILGLLNCRGTLAVEYMDELVDLINRHHELYVQLYPHTVKPKWHHMLHLPSQYRAMAKIISCFVTERKHRSLKRAALYVSRYLEHTSLNDLGTQQCEQILDGHSLFQREFLGHPSTVQILGQTLTRSRMAVLECGNIHGEDIIYVGGGELARVADFWQFECGVITAQCTAREHVASVAGYTYRDTASVIFVQSQKIIDAVAYRNLADGEFRVVLPYLARHR